MVELVEIRVLVAPAVVVGEHHKQELQQLQLLAAKEVMVHHLQSQVQPPLMLEVEVVLA
jgi:hypothetical protein